VPESRALGQGQGAPPGRERVRPRASSAMARHQRAIPASRCAAPWGSRVAC